MEVENLAEGAQGGCAMCVIVLKQVVIADFFLQV